MTGSGRSPGEGNGNPLQYSCLENPMDIGIPCSLVGYSPRGHTELDMTERLTLSLFFHFMKYKMCLRVDGSVQVLHTLPVPTFHDITIRNTDKLWGQTYLIWGLSFVAYFVCKSADYLTIQATNETNSDNDT